MVGKAYTFEHYADMVQNFISHMSNNTSDENTFSVKCSQQLHVRNFKEHFEKFILKPVNFWPCEIKDERVMCIADFLEEQQTVTARYLITIL